MLCARMPVLKKEGSFSVFRNMLHLQYVTSAIQEHCKKVYKPKTFPTSETQACVSKHVCAMLYFINFSSHCMLQSLIHSTVLHRYTQTLRSLNRGCWYTYVRRTNKIHDFFITDLIQLHYLRHVSNNYVFIIRNTVQTTLRYFILHLYKQSSHCQDVSSTSFNLVDCLHNCMGNIPYKAACTM
jgi:short subunit dehydrogenase-like uncharacterized protein